jgi:3-oxoacyl-[acyl-carrier-protein] synthase-3
MMYGRMRIDAVGRYLPATVVTAADLEDRMQLPAGWIGRKTGVLERRWVDGESPLEMAVAACDDAFGRSSLVPKDVDLIIYAAATPHQILPDTASLLQRELGLGASGIKAFSVHSTCLSFLTALDLAATFIMMGRHHNVLIATAEVASIAIDFSHPESASLLGDMATAVLVTEAPAHSDSTMRSMVFKTYGDHADLCRVEAGYAKHPLMPSTKDEDYLFHMDGPAIFRAAYRLFPPIIAEALTLAEVTIDDLDVVVPHQASVLAVKSIQRALGISDNQIVMNLDHVGNCVAASIPGAIFDGVASGQLKRGDTVLLAGTGAGLSLAACVLTW